jgi:hypothetical protein
VFCFSYRRLCMCVFFLHYVSDNSIRICIIWLIGFLGVLEATCVCKREFYRDIGGKGRCPFCVALELIVIGCDLLCWVVVFDKLVELVPPKFYVPLKGSNDIWVSSNSCWILNIVAIGCGILKWHASSLFVVLIIVYAFLCVFMYQKLHA